MTVSIVYILYYIKMIRSFRHKGLEELHQEGKTRRIRPAFIRKCVEILMYLEAAYRPEMMNIAGYYFLCGCTGNLEALVSQGSTRTTGSRLAGMAKMP